MTTIKTRTPATVAPKTLSFSQIEALWIQAGGAPAWAATMAGIAEAESGGNTGAIAGNPSSPSGSTDAYGGSYGLWQINGSHNGVTDATPPSQGGALPSSAWVSSMFNPLANAQAAVALLGNGSGISAWQGDAVGQLAQNGTPLSLGTVSAVMHSIGVPAAQLVGAKDFVSQTAAQVATTSWWTSIWADLNLASIGGTSTAGGVVGVSSAGGSGSGATATLTSFHIPNWLDLLSPATGPFMSVYNDLFGAANSASGLIKAADVAATDITLLVHDVTDVKWWTRVGEFLLGAALLIGGAVLFVTSTSSKGTGGAVEGAAGDAAKAAVVA